MKRNSWTSYEENAILHYVKSYPNNLQFAFEEASKELSNRTPKAIGVRYYKILKQKTTVMSVVTASGRSTLNNQKNMPRDLKGILSQEDQLNIILDTLKKMSRQNKKKVVEVLFGL